jgi:hypothetical protein
MLKYKDRFDDAMLRERSERVGGLPPGSDSAKVRKAGASQRQDELPDSVSRAIDEIWLRDVAPQTGFESFAALEAAVRQLA